MGSSVLVKGAMTATMTRRMVATTASRRPAETALARARRSATTATRRTATGALSSWVLPARCGDGLVRTDLAVGAPGYEACDDGNADPADACTATCELARCGIDLRGDLFKEQGFEECDDGNVESGDGCSVTCGLERCGNGRIDQGELCDDGNAVDTDGCTSACQPARCGDGIRRNDLEPGADAFEACDDGNRESGDDAPQSAASSAVVTVRWMRVSSVMTATAWTQTPARTAA